MANVWGNCVRQKRIVLEKYVTVLWCYCASTIRSHPIYSSPHEGWSSLFGRSGLKKDCFLSVPCPPFLSVQAERSSLHPYRIFTVLNLTMKMEAVCYSESLVCVWRTTWCHTDSSLLWPRYRLDGLRFESWQDQDIFMSSSSSRPVVGLLTLLWNDILVLSHGQCGRCVKLTPPSSAEG